MNKEKTVKIRKKFKIDNLNFRSLIELNKEYPFYIAQNTHKDNKLIRELKYFVFKKEEEKPFEEIKDFSSPFIKKEIKNFLLNEKITFKKNDKFKIYCSYFDKKNMTFEISLKINKKNVKIFSGTRKEKSEIFLEFSSFLNIADEKFVIKIFRTFLYNAGLKYDLTKEKGIFIPGNVPSSKNSKQMTRSKVLLSSKAVRKYLKNYSFFWLLYEPDFKFLIEKHDKPLKIEFQFTRESKASFDYINIVQLPLDLMQKYNWIENDDVYNVKPFFSDFVINKEMPGVKINII